LSRNLAGQALPTFGNAKKKGGAGTVSLGGKGDRSREPTLDHWPGGTLNSSRNHKKNVIGKKSRPLRTDVGGNTKARLSGESGKTKKIKEKGKGTHFVQFELFNLSTGGKKRGTRANRAKQGVGAESGKKGRGAHPRVV